MYIFMYVMAIEVNILTNPHVYKVKVLLCQR